MRLEDVAESPHFVEWADVADPGLLPPVPSLGGRSAADLAELVEDPTRTVAERLAAGTALAVMGDPRIDDVPVTCHVAGGVVRVGLPKAAVTDVADEWRHVGVEDSWIQKETPEHDVLLSEFWICRYPVTNGEYVRFLRETDWPRRPTTWTLGAYPFERSNHPVAGIDPESADQYASWLSERSGHPWRLPTEYEWEHAAKGFDGRDYPWGDHFDENAANTRESGIHTTSPVGAFPAGVSPFGAQDMAGNVEEFVADDYRPYPDGPTVDDHLTQTLGGYRVARGGSFSRFGDLCRTRRRHGAFPGPLYPIGFRLATASSPIQAAGSAATTTGVAKA